MHILPNERPFGVAPDILISCAVALAARISGFDHRDFYVALGAPPREADSVLAQMEEAGYIARQPGEMPFVGTTKLSQLALASISQGLPREAAEQLLAKIISTAEQVNASPDIYPYGVTCIAVFGSFLGEKPVLGDLDVGVDLGKRRGPRPEISHWRDALDRDASDANKTYAALRLRKPKLISIHSMKEVAELGTPYRIVFGSWSASEPTGGHQSEQAHEPSPRT